MTTLIDTNILIYLTRPNDGNHSRAVEMFEQCKEQGPILLTDFVYAEFSIGMPSKEATDLVVRELALERINMDDQALYESGQQFKAYKNRTGKRDRLLPDHFIGAHARTLGVQILTNNPADYDDIEGLQVVTLV